MAAKPNGSFSDPVAIKNRPSAIIYLSSLLWPAMILPCGLRGRKTLKEHFGPPPPSPHPIPSPKLKQPLAKRKRDYLSISIFQVTFNSWQLQERWHTSLKERIQVGDRISCCLLHHHAVRPKWVLEGDHSEVRTFRTVYFSLVIYNFITQTSLLLCWGHLK